MEKLNIRQKAFCEYYVQTGNATESAIKAGYSETYSKNRIHDLLKKVGICGYIEQLQEKAKSKRIMTAIERREWLTKLLNDENVKINDKLKALDILNKMDGEYTEKLQISKDMANPFENIDSEDIKRLIENAK